MSDVERRLDLGRGGKKVQDKEKEIIEGLEKIIKKLEQQGQGQGDGDGQGGGNNPDKPADDSRVKGQTAPGTVDPKKLSKNGGWGSLPDKTACQGEGPCDARVPVALSRGDRGIHAEGGGPRRRQGEVRRRAGESGVRDRQGEGKRSNSNRWTCPLPPQNRPDPRRV